MRRPAPGGAAHSRGGRRRRRSRSTRRAPAGRRYKIISGIEVLIDGNPALLVDLSTVGAQVVSATLLKPNQRVRLSFIEAGVRCGSAPAWLGPRLSR